MSTGFECAFLSLQETGEWFYVLQDADCPVGAWDWREYATAYGPFTSQKMAHKHLHEYHANPGGFSVTENIATPTHDPLKRLIAEARTRELWRIW